MLKIYEQEGLDSLKKLEELQKLEKSWSEIPTKEKKAYTLSKESKKTLSILNREDVVSVLEWNCYTVGNNSPAIFTGGNVEVWYGVPKNIFLSITSTLDFQQKKIEERETQLKEYKKNYAKLIFSSLNSNNPLENEIKRLTTEGNIGEAISLQKRSKSIIVSRSDFILAQLYDLVPLKDSALYYFKAAYGAEPDSIKYGYFYALTLKRYGYYAESSDVFFKMLSNPKMLIFDGDNYGFDIYKEIGLNYLEESKFNDAIKSFNIALIKYPFVSFETPPNEIYLYLAKSYLFIHKLDSCNYFLDAMLFPVRLGTDTSSNTFKEYIAELKSFQSERFLVKSNMYDKQELHSEALRSSLNALDIVLSFSDSLNYRCIEIYEAISQAYDGLKKNNLAIYFAKKSLQLDSIYYGIYSSNYANSLNNFGNIMVRVDPLRAENVFSQANIILKSIHREESPEFASNLNTLSYISFKKKDFTTALKMQQKANKILNDIYGLYHTETFMSFEALYNICKQLKDCKNLKYYRQQCYKIAAKIYPNNLRILKKYQ